MKHSTCGKSKVIKIVLWGIFSPFLLFISVALACLLTEKYIVKSPVPMFAGYASLIVATGSMDGTINQGDMIIIKKTGDYQLGDIVTYIEADTTVPVTHRLVNYGSEDRTFIAKGDANRTSDILPVSVEQIVGEVILTIPRAGIFLEWFSTQGGVIYILAMLVILVACVFFWNLMKRNSETSPDASGESSLNHDNIKKNSR